MTRRMDDRGQIHTMEGVVAGLILVLTLMYITSSITFISPQTDKAMVMKLNIKAGDVLNVLTIKNQPNSYANQLVQNVSMWNGSIANYTAHVHASESNMSDLNLTIGYMLHDSPDHFNLQYNLYLIYENASGYVSVPVILNGEPQDNAASASKIIIINENEAKSAYWDDMAMPKAVEVKLVVWSI